MLQRTSALGWENILSPILLREAWLGFFFREKLLSSYFIYSWFQIFSNANWFLTSDYQFKPSLEYSAKILCWPRIDSQNLRRASVRDGTQRNWFPMLHWSFVEKGLSISIFFKYQEYILCIVDLKHTLIIDVCKLMLHSNSGLRLILRMEIIRKSANRWLEPLPADEKVWKFSVFIRPYLLYQMEVDCNPTFGPFFLIRKGTISSLTELICTSTIQVENLFKLPQRTV